MFDSWFIGLGGGMLLILTAGIVKWLIENKLESLSGYVIAASIFVLRSSILRSGATTSAEIAITKGIEENRGTLDFLSAQFNWTLFFMVAASAWVIWDKVLPDFINRHFKINFTLPNDTTMKPNIRVMRRTAEEEHARKRA